MNKKGFTLVELLVVIAILGIITMLSLPLLRGIEEKNENSKVNTYSKSVESSGKLYIDSYAEDLFGHEKSGCAYIKYSDLEKRELINDIKDTNLSCDTDNTFIRVVKLNNQYGYSVYLGCGPKAGDAVANVSISYPEKGKIYEPDPTACAPGQSNIVISATGYVNPAVYDKKRRTAKVKLTSPTGLNSSPIIYYSWQKDTNYGAVTDWKKIDFRIPGGQEKKILAGETITASSGGIVTPENGDGDYRLLLKVERLEDFTGKPWTNPDGSNSPYVNFGLYSIDGIPPVLETLTATSAKAGFNSKDIKINLKGSDNHTPTKDLKVCISESKTGCDKGTYKNYAETFNHTVSGDYDGKDRTIYVSLKDKGENVTKKTVNYTIYKNCTQTKDNGTWTDKTACTKTCGGGTKVQESPALDKFTGVKCPSSPKHERTVSCNTQSCRPNKPTIVNPSNEYWSLGNFSLTVSTTTPANEIGYWYYSYDNTNFTRYDKPEYNSYGKNTFVTSPYIAERDEYTYIRVCNRKASGPTDMSNCSDSASTKIRISRQEPAINNPTNGNRTENQFSLTVRSMKVPASEIGYWYYSYDNVNFTRYDKPEYNSYGKEVFETSPFVADRHQLAYIRFCSKKASGPNDDTNCSHSGSTMIWIGRCSESNPTACPWTTACRYAGPSGGTGFTTLYTQPNIYSMEAGLARHSPVGTGPNDTLYILGTVGDFTKVYVPNCQKGTYWPSSNIVYIVTKCTGPHNQSCPYYRCQG